MPQPRRDKPPTRALALAVAMGLGMAATRAFAAPPANLDAYVYRTLVSFGVPGAAVAIVEPGGEHGEDAAAAGLAWVSAINGPIMTVASASRIFVPREKTWIGLSTVISANL